MLPIKVIRSLTHDKRAQAIGEALSTTNNKVAEQYLEVANRRIAIEREAVLSTTKVNLPKPEDSWIVDESIKYYRSKFRRAK